MHSCKKCPNDKHRPTNFHLPERYKNTKKNRSRNTSFNGFIENNNKKNLKTSKKKKKTNNIKKKNNIKTPKKKKSKPKLNFKINSISRKRKQIDNHKLRNKLKSIRKKYKNKKMSKRQKLNKSNTFPTYTKTNITNTSSFWLPVPNIKER